MAGSEVVTDLVSGCVRRPVVHVRAELPDERNSNTTNRRSVVEDKVVLRHVDAQRCHGSAGFGGDLVEGRLGRSTRVSNRTGYVHCHHSRLRRGRDRVEIQGSVRILQVHGLGAAGICVQDVRDTRGIASGLRNISIVHSNGQC